MVRSQHGSGGSGSSIMQGRTRKVIGKNQHSAGYRQSQSNTHILDNPVHKAEHSWQYLYLRNAYARTVEGQVGKLPHRRNYRQYKGYLGRPGQMRQEWIRQRSAGLIGGQQSRSDGGGRVMTAKSEVRSWGGRLMPAKAEVMSWGGRIMAVRSDVVQ